MPDKTGTQWHTIGISYVWPVPLPDNLEADTTSGQRTIPSISVTLWQVPVQVQVAIFVNYYISLFIYGPHMTLSPVECQFMVFSSIWCFPETGLNPWGSFMLVRVVWRGREICWLRALHRLIKESCLFWEGTLSLFGNHKKEPVTNQENMFYNRSLLLLVFLVILATSFYQIQCAPPAKVSLKITTAVKCHFLHTSTFPMGFPPWLLPCQTLWEKNPVLEYSNMLNKQIDFGSLVVIFVWSWLALKLPRRRCSNIC